MDDAAARSHPLHVAGGDGAAVSHAVTMFHRSRKHVGDGFDAAVRMPREACQIVLGNIIAEVIEQEERIGFLGISETESAAKMDACAFKRRLRFDDSFNWSNGHRISMRKAF